MNDVHSYGTQAMIATPLASPSVHPKTLEDYHMGVDRLALREFTLPKFQSFNNKIRYLYIYTISFLFPNKAWGGGTLVLHGVGQPISLGFLVGSLLKDFVYVVKAASPMFQKLPEAVAIHMFRQGIGKLRSWMHPVRM